MEGSFFFREKERLDFTLLPKDVDVFTPLPKDVVLAKMLPPLEGAGAAAALGDLALAGDLKRLGVSAARIPTRDAAKDSL